MRQAGAAPYSSSPSSSSSPATPARGTGARQAIKMDWQGQKCAEMLMQALLVAAAVAAFLVGYVLGDFQLMLLIYAGGVALTALVTVPDWPFFNRHQLKWLDPAEADRHPRPQVSAVATGGKKKTGKNK